MTRERHITTTKIDWQGITLSVEYEEAFLGFCRPSPSALAHLQIRSIMPDRAALPMTETGYRSHFIHPDAIDEAGGAIAYVIAWLEHDARKPEWRKQQANGQQLSLF